MAVSDDRKGLGTWIGSLKHRNGKGDTAKMDQWSQNDGAHQSLWSTDVAAAMGYGKNGRAGSAYQWWIMVVAALLAIASFIAWCIFIFRARDSTQGAVDALKLQLGWWEALRSILLATAICYPIFAVLAITISLWRALLARRLNIHAPDSRWMRSCKAWQVANVISSVLLYGMFLLMVVSVAAHAVWAYTARMGHLGSFYAIKYVDPVWSGVGNVINQTTGLVDSFVGLAGTVTGANGRRLTQFDPVKGVMLTELTAADLAVLPPHVIEAGVAASRSLQQAQGVMDVIQNVVTGAANVLGNAANAVANGPNLANILPGGNDNPLLGTLQRVTQAVQQQVLNKDGCPMYCVDLSDQPWIRDGCICNLDRVKAAYPYLQQVFRDVGPALVCVFLMMVSASWLLLHSASQWSRTRCEAKLLSRLPNAAALQCANRQFIDPEEVDPAPFSLLQCRRGYAAYGRSSGRCRTCPHIALAWFGFLLARLLDLLFIALLALLWLGLGWLKASYASSAVGALKDCPGKGLTMQNSVFGPRLAKTLSGKLQKFEDSYQEKQKARLQQKQQQRRTPQQPSRLSGLRGTTSAATPGGSGKVAGDASQKQVAQVLPAGMTSTMYCSPGVVLNSKCSASSTGGSCSGKIPAIIRADPATTPSFTGHGLGTMLPSGMSGSVNGYDDLSSAPSAALPDPCQHEQQHYQLVQSSNPSASTAMSAGSGAQVAVGAPVGKLDSGMPTAFRAPLTSIESMETCRQGSEHLTSHLASVTQADSGPQGDQSPPTGLLRLFNFQKILNNGGGGPSPSSSGSLGRRRLNPVNSHLARYKDGSGSLGGGSLTPAAAAAVTAALSGVSIVSDNEIRRAHEEYAALLLVVVRHLACLAQSRRLTLSHQLLTL
eukprot:gene1789-2123_t